MTPSHTPGPWFVNGPTISGGADSCGIPLPIAHILNPYSGAAGAADRIAANATLIAAAPELLAALQAIAAMAGEDAGTFRRRGGTYRGLAGEMARAAIARATGQA